MPAFDPNAYETVDSRIKRFYQDHPEGRINTELVAYDGSIGATRWIVKASVFRASGYDSPDGVDYAFEVDGSGGMANKTAALENCATSAIGRALANIGYSGDKRASREEMAKATAPAPAKPAPDWASKVAAAEDLAGLSEVHAQAVAEGWATPDLMQALTARKTALGIK